ncbi:pyruvate carboxylase [Mucor velutinosus]|uniref:Pyruvate carboxylase n=1 Tax=Mucor velutinosus TaxID=708070 RepID=A0AAN7HPA0_9FUNG|nr:pyruvate carboxylase [Mucor velutinosus]
MSITTSCLITSNAACRKRKRSLGSHVRFSTQPQSIIYTYSQSDYDRSGLSSPEIQTQHDKQKFILALAINFVGSVASPPSPPAEQPAFVKKSKNKRPKLSIDTTNLQGPLYFTNMTTNHQKKALASPPSPVEGVDELEELDIITKENTRRNSLPLVL